MNHVIPEFDFSTFVSRAFEKTKTIVVPLFVS